MKAVAYLLVRLGVGGLFLAAGALKLADPQAFAIEIANYQLFPIIAPWLAVALPSTEIVVGVALVAGPPRWARAGALAASLMLSAFTAAAASAVVRGINISCGCFGSDSGPVTWLTVLRDVALVAAALWVYASPQGLPRWPRRPAGASASHLAGPFFEGAARDAFEKCSKTVLSRRRRPHTARRAPSARGRPAARVRHAAPARGGDVVYGDSVSMEPDHDLFSITRLRN